MGAMTAASRGRREAEYAARWAAGAWRGATLRAESGEVYALVFEGRRGGGVGPDFRDAVLARADGTRLYGDVELHLRVGAWRAHGHSRDARYNGVVLHVVFRPPGRDEERRTQLASGRSAPIVALAGDWDGEVEGPLGRALAAWPCVGLAERAGAGQLRALLLEAGMARLRLKAAAFARELRECEASPGRGRWTPADRVLWAALAEGLGYGRDREALRRAGELLAAGLAPEAVTAASDGLAGVERVRLGGMLALFERWHGMGPWKPLRRRLCAGAPVAAARGLVAEMGVAGGAVSPGRAKILCANVALPFAAGWAELAGEAGLRARAEEVYRALPGLPANAITREMGRQLGLRRLPAGAAAQQGLHHVWAMHCREKRCEGCPCAVGMG
jgi:uncharacterized protein DUF2851